VPAVQGTKDKEAEARVHQGGRRKGRKAKETTPQRRAKDNTRRAQSKESQKGREGQRLQSRGKTGVQRRGGGDPPRPPATGKAKPSPRRNLPLMSFKERLTQDH